LHFAGSPGDDVLRVDTLDGVFQGTISGNAMEGFDQLLLVGAGQSLDLAAPSGAVREIELIDITGSGNNSLNLDVGEVLAMSSTSDELYVRANLADTVDIGGGWRLARVADVDGVFYRVLEQDGTALHLNGPANWQHPFERHDVNNNGITRDPVGDILVLINELNGRNFISEDGRLPAAAASTFPGFYYDVNGDGFLSPVGDVLVQINFANSPSSPEGEGGEVRHAGTQLAGRVVADRVLADGALADAVFGDAGSGGDRTARPAPRTAATFGPWPSVVTGPEIERNRSATPGDRATDDDGCESVDLFDELAAALVPVNPLDRIFAEYPPRGRQDSIF
jgi:hypothetical protein